jgi:hypothetical protein
MLAFFLCLIVPVVCVITNHHYFSVSSLAHVVSNDIML